VRARCVAPLSALTVLLAGCYRYAPMTDGTPGPGAEVRLALGPAASPDLFRVLGERTEAVEGRVTSASDAGYTVAVSGTRKTGETSTTAWVGEQVTIPRAAIAGVQRRTLDKKKTFGIAGIAILAAAGTKLLIDGFSSKSGGEDNGGVTPPPPP
jgi:hypothetical protein